MKKFYGILLLVLLAVAGNGYAQTFFSTEKGAFLRDLNDYLVNNASKENAAAVSALTSDFSTRWNSYYGTADAEIVMDLCERLHARTGSKAYASILSFVMVLDKLPDSGLTRSDVTNWLACTQSKHAKSLNKFDSYIDSYRSFFVNGNLCEQGNSAWKLENARIAIPSDKDPVLSVNAGTLVLHSENDSSLIRNAKGLYHFDTHVWEGVSGTADWSRFGMASTQVYAEFPSRYSVEMTKSEYVVDSVWFYNKTYSDRPVLCSFTDKVSNSKPNEKTQFPKVRPIKVANGSSSLFNDVSFEGGLGMTGRNAVIFGDVNSKAKLTFYKNKRTAATIQASRLALTDGSVVSDHCVARIYLYDTVDDHRSVDSIYHNDLGLRYDNQSRKLVLYRSETGYGDGPFHDSFHGMDIFLEALYWNVDADVMEFHRLEGANNLSEGELYSANYFRQSDYRQMQGLDGVHPMVRIESFMKSHPNPDEPNTFLVNDLASYLQYPIEQVLTMVFRLQAEGYLEYDQENKTITVLQRFIDVLESNRETIDYDVFKIKTSTTNRQPNLRLDMNTNELAVFGIVNPIGGAEGSSVVLSDRKHIVILPYDGKIVLRRNRDFRFSGTVMAGMLELFADNCLFKYDDFSIDMPNIDSLRMYARQGNTIYPVEGTLEHLQGRLMIDHPDNKSSKTDDAAYPLFHCDNNSYKFYRKINGGVFDPHLSDDEINDENLKGKFYYLLDPFTADSLNDLTMNDVNFSGKLMSGGVFQVINEPLTVMEDHSLGFEHHIGKNDGDSYAMFDGTGRFRSHIHLSEDGFYGNGSLDYQTASLSSGRFMFYLDSVTARVDSFTMAEANSGVPFPKASCQELDMNWNVYKPQLEMKTLKDPICLYDSTYFKGESFISPDGYVADGSVSFGLTRFLSKHFDFNYHSFVADSADFVLYSADSVTEAFLANNYKVLVNFDLQQVSYNYLDASSSFDFPFNQYLCTLNEANWDMKSNNISLFSPNANMSDYAKAKTVDELLAVKTSVSKFISVCPGQDSLEFYCLRADYDMSDYSIHAHDVKIIRVADAAIFPSEGNVNINHDASIEQIGNASILASTEKKYHFYKDAVVNIQSRNMFKGDGYMDYTSVDGISTPVHYDSITPVGGLTTGFAQVADSAEFFLSPQFAFSGKIRMVSSEEFGHFDGIFRMIQQCADAKGWFPSSSTINPAEVRIPVVMSRITADRPKLCNGLYYDNSRKGRCFASFMSPTNAEQYTPIMPVDGMLSYDTISDRFTVIDDKNPDTYLSLSDRCEVSGHGTFDLGLDTHLAKFVCNGSFTDLPGDSIMLDVLNVFDLPIFDDKILADMADVYGKVEGESIDLDSTNFISYAKTDKSKKNGDLAKSIELNGYPEIKAGDFYDKTIVMPTLHMAWNEAVGAFVSSGKIGIGNLGTHVVNKYVNGHVVFDPRLGTVTYFFEDGLFMTYLCYNCGNKQLQIHATWGDVNSRLSEMKESVRSKTVGDDSFMYVVVPYEALTNFLTTMKRAGLR